MPSGPRYGLCFFSIPFTITRIVMNIESSAYISDTLRALEENLAMLIDMQDMMSKEEEALVIMLHEIGRAHV